MTTDTIKATPKERFLVELQKLNGAPGPDWMKRVRKAGEESVKALDFPHHKEEEWRFTNIKPILQHEYAPAAAPADHGLDAAAVEPYFLGTGVCAELVFVNGFYEPALSRAENLPQGLTAGNLANAGDHGATLEKHLGQHAPARPNMFNALNAAFLHDGAFIYAAQNCVAREPVHLIFLTTTGENGPVAAYPRVLAVAEANSEAAFIEQFAPVGQPGVYFNSVVTEMAAAEGARLTHYKVTQEADEAFHMATIRGAQEKDSVIQSFSFTFRGRIVRNDVSSVLGGEGGDCKLNGLYLTQADQLVDNHTFIEHAAPHCASWIGYKGVLDGKSHGVFTGKILVQRDAQKTDSNQLNSNMLLTDTATIDTKPQLEIFADDVKCTHGSTTGKPPEEVIFYFRSRGISEEMARGMLTYGFASEVLEDVDVESLRSRLDRWIFHRYSPKKHTLVPEKAI